MIAFAFLIGVFAIAAIAILLARGAAPPRDLEISTPFVTDWDIAQAFEQADPELGHIEYRFLGVTGEEDA